jgi:tripartite ATP-independent transporter DctM subunit
MQVKAMTEKGFPKPFSAAISVASATATPIFPPSIPYVVFGAVTGTSIIRLFLAGIVPGFITIGLLMLFTAYLGIKRKYPRQPRLPTRKEVWDGFLPTIPALLAPVLLIGGLLLGFFTPTEAASIVVAYVIIIGVFFYRDLTFAHIVKAAVITIKQTGAICIIITVATLFGWVMTIERIPLLFTNAMQPFMNNRILLLIVINLILLFIGMFLDSNTATLIVIPIMMPTLLAAGLDPVHIGVMVVFNLMIGLLTPPLGLSVLLISNVTEMRVGEVFRAVPIFFIPLFLVLALITYIPEITLWIPNLLMK